MKSALFMVHKKGQTSVCFKMQLNYHDRTTCAENVATCHPTTLRVCARINVAFSDSRKSENINFSLFRYDNFRTKLGENPFSLSSFLILRLLE